MAPVTRHFIDTLRLQEQKVAPRGVPLEGKQYMPIRLMHCTLHLDQVQGNNFPLRKIQKLNQRTTKKAAGRIIYPLTFKPFQSEMLGKDSKDGNVSFIVNFDQLLQRFPRIYDYGLCKTTNGWRQSVLLTRGKRDVSRYTPLVAATPSVAGDIWWQDDEQNKILTPLSPRTNEQLQLEVNVDVLASDLKWLRKRWACEYLDHEECTKYGELCTNLMERGVAWEACHF